ncbi:cobinamide kinase [Virgibacillus phasianinus]|uniref:Adenosylcobinamide kinase n=1 Tax=Virgibacillus phasianinus TaxID=2017483 RepID=A0A220U0S7_9BACI|nr:bifunctional adenosylcobinamide kinase/adenosylcobinamide-phosphate guanylyltransferase [Virgibacillus phasianinus]ASK61854.1 cobinamide kinase [Virgibacillus phasianinus]
MEEKKLIFITGGVRSGKSTFAENYATSFVKGNEGTLRYIATSRPSDREMTSRISIHQLQRLNSGFNWETLEFPFNMAKAASFVQQSDIVLLDCLTVLLTNELFRDGFSENIWEQQDYQAKVMQLILEGIDAIRGKAKLLLIVSNEVLNEHITDRSLVQTYGRLLGMLHQELVRMSSEAYLVEAGIPILMKGGQPNEGHYDSRNRF